MSNRKRISIKIGKLVASSDKKTFQTIKNNIINIYYVENCICNKILKTEILEKTKD